MEDIIVVGGGISGAVCFRDLARRGKRVLLLEARSRLGGRSCTESMSNGCGDAVDTGGQWVGRAHTTMLSLCSELKLELEEQAFPSPPSSPSASPVSPEMAYYRLRELTEEAKAQVSSFQSFLVESYRSLTGNEESRLGMEQAWDRSSMRDVIDAHCGSSPEAVEELTFFVQTVLAIDPEPCSFLFFLHYVFVWGGGDKGMVLLGDGPEGLQALKVKEGTQQICEKLAKQGEGGGGRVLLNCPVSAIECDAATGFVLVRADTGETYRSQRVVIAVPPPLYKSLAFKPSNLLCDKRRALFDAMRMGSAVKVICVFDNAFWRTADQELSSRLSVSEVGLISNIFESEVGEQPALICLITGNLARLYSSMDEKAERQARVLAQLKAMYLTSRTQQQEPTLLAFIEKDWTAEQFSGGGYAAIVGPSSEAVFASHGHLLRAPIVPGRILLAGTEASTEFYGYLEGGARRGQQVASEICALGDGSSNGGSCNDDGTVSTRPEAGGELVLVPEQKQSTFMTVATRVPAAFFLLWLGCLLYTIWDVLYPSHCHHPRGSHLFMQHCYAPLLPPGLRVDIKLYAGLPTEDNRLSGELVWEQKNHSVYEKIDASFAVPVPAGVRIESKFLNGWIVISPTTVESGNSNSEGKRESDGAMEAFAAARRVISSHLLTTLKPALGQTRDRHLLHQGSQSQTQQQQQQHAASGVVQHWKYSHHPLTIRYTHYGDLVLGTYLLSSLNYNLGRRYVHVPPGARYQLTYEPIIFVDDLALLRRQEMELSSNLSMPSPKMRLQFLPTSPLNFGYKRIMKTVVDVLGEFLKEPELEEIKYWMSDDRMYRYFLTQGITLLHIFLEYMAFRDDWRFFVGRTSFGGISSTSMIFGVVRSMVIFLYLVDADTSMIVLFSVGKDVLWSMWKLRRMLKPRIYLYRGFWPSVTYMEPCNLTPEEQRSAHHDNVATSHMSLCIYPLVAGLAAYSLLNYKYKSWWTWFISSLADSVYFFGFISMTPQLYINYKLRSVAHLPVRALMFKIFSTFIDDAYALMVKMPLKHRLMTLRDDVIFFGFLYQWWIYRVDKSRPNEFGFIYDDAPKTIEEKEDKEEGKGE